MVWPHLNVFWLSKDGSARHSAKKNKKRWEDNIKEWTGMDFVLLTQLGQLKTGLGGKGML